MVTVVENSELYDLWTHKLVISMVKSTKLTLHIAAVPAIYNLFGNLGGAYTLLTLIYALLYTVKSPDIETHFSPPGVSAMKWLFAKVHRLLPFKHHTMPKYVPQQNVQMQPFHSF